MGDRAPAVSRPDADGVLSLLDESVPLMSKRAFRPSTAPSRVQSWSWTGERWVRPGDPATARVATQPVDPLDPTVIYLSHDCVDGRSTDPVPSARGAAGSTETPTEGRLLIRDRPGPEIVACSWCSYADTVADAFARSGVDLAPAVPLDVLRKVLEEHRPWAERHRVDGSPVPSEVGGADCGESSGFMETCVCGQPWPSSSRLPSHVAEEVLHLSGLSRHDWKRAL